MEDGDKKRKAEEQITSDSTKEENAEIEVTQEEDLSWLNEYSIAELKNLADERGLDYKGIAEKPELVEKIKQKLIADLSEGIPIKRKKTTHRKDCPYLDTINRKVLDFDFEKVCSVTLQNLNVYACLVCGKYFQGRGRNSQAYVHSLQYNHHVFINLHTEKIYCLPDDYEVIDPSLSDIKYYLNPKYTYEMIKKMDETTKTVVALDGTEYIPGFVGFNNIKNVDYINSIIQALLHVVPLRNFFMNDKNIEKYQDTTLSSRFGDLIRKVYNAKNFKSHVSPHEVLQAISTASNKKFRIGARGDPLEFLLFFLNHLHTELGGTRKPGSSIIHKVFQGQLENFSEVKKRTREQELMDEEIKQKIIEQPEFKCETVPFMYLSLEIPPPPLFKDEQEKNIIPQKPIYELLSKYDGRTITNHINLGISVRKKFKLLKLPQYLVIHCKRFAKNQFFMEKNPTIVNFPLVGLDLSEYYEGPKTDKPRYNLLANIVHEGDPETGTWKVHVFNKATEQWYEIQDLSVRPILPQLIVLSEAYIQIYEKQ